MDRVGLHQLIPFEGADSYRVVPLEMALRHGQIEMKLVFGLTIFAILLTVAVSNALSILGIGLIPIFAP